jgi:threonine dehydrogenase-like Zn-dependent dehydrogenase
MKAVCWYGIRDVRVLDVPEPRILNPRDAIVEVTSTSICGSDLHLYDGYIPSMRQGDILGHEFMGRVVEVGNAVTNLKVGDRVVVPFTIACGECFYCQHGMWSLCDNSNPNAWMVEKVYGYTPAGLYGYSHLMGGYAGGQAEYVRVPFADVGPLRIPDGLTDEQVLLISDVLPTGYMAAEACNIQPGDTVAIWGCGPVGQMAIRCAYHLGAARVIAIDAVPERLAMAREYGSAETINYAERRNVVQALKEMTAGRGPDACIEAVGMETLGHTVDALYDRVKQAVRLETGRPHALREAIQACRKGGTISIPGVYIGFVDKVPMGAAFGKGLTLKMGQTHVQKYMRTLLGIVERGEIDPSYIFTHTMGLDEAPRAYAMLAARAPGFVKVMLKPEMVARGEGRRARRGLAEEQPTEMPASLPETGRGSPAQRASGPPLTKERLTWGEPDGTTEVPPMPSQAEGSRETIEADLCEKGLAPREECEGRPAEERPEDLVTGRRLPSQAEGERETVEEDLGDR